MGLESGKSESSSQAQGSFNQDIWGGQAPALEQLYKTAGNLFSDVTGQQQNLIPGATQNMQDISGAAMPAFKQQLAGGATSGMDLQEMLAQSLKGSMGKPSQTAQMYANIMGGKGNDYAAAMKGGMQDDANMALKNAMSVADARAVGAGQSGSSRHGVLQSNLFNDINTNLLQGLTKVGFDTFDKDLSNKMNIAQMADTGLFNQQNLMANMIGGQDTAQQTGLNFGQGMQNLGMGSFAPGMMPWQSAGNYANILGQPTVLGSGTSTSGSGSDSKSKGMSL